MEGREPHLIDGNASRDGAPGGGEARGGAQGPKAEARQRSQAGEPARRRLAETTKRIR